MAGGTNRTQIYWINAVNNAMKYTLNYKLSQPFHRISAIAISILALTSVVGVAFFGWFQHPPVLENGGIYVNYGGVGLEHFIIMALLVFSAITIWFPKRVLRWLTLVFLGLILLEYILWAISSYQLRLYSEYDGSLDSFFLRGASLWDIIVLVFVFLTFVCLSLMTQQKKHFA